MIGIMLFTYAHNSKQFILAIEKNISEFKAIYIIYLIHIHKDYNHALELWESIKDTTEKSIELLIAELMVKYVSNQQDNEYLKAKLLKELNLYKLR